jgi:hypothetical protein
VDKRLRELVFQRSEGYCQWCGGSLSLSWAIHHRKLKSQGGKDTADNLIALHHECHNLGTHAVHLNVALACERGFIVRSWLNPLTIAVEYADGVKWYLDDEGNAQAESRTSIKKAE